MSTFITPGEVHHRLTILDTKWGRQKPTKSNALGKRQLKVKCRCVCGTEFETRAQDILRGNTKSCGCLARELTAARFAAKRNLRTKAA